MNYLPLPSDKAIQSALAHVEKRHPKMVVFDLDETLVSTHYSNTEGTVPIQINDETIFVFIRPYAKDILVNLAPFYDICILTASD